ncbi:MAG TPA: GNAT family N-acetyltransferase, partial [Ktedonobacteraceae bacterium]|nr:GNAT family N-acetyltransferase [Ktedonobacteraceae bacterium]
MITTPHINTHLSSLVEEQAKNIFYYDPRWFELINKLYGYRVITLTATNAEGQISGYLPLCLVSSFFTGRRLVSLPFSDQCPLLAADEATANELIDKAIQLARQEHVKYLELRAGSDDVLIKRPEFTENNLYVNWIVPLYDCPEDVWKGLRKPVQHQIKKSQKHGIRIRTADQREDMGIYYKLHLQTRTKKHGMPAQSKDYFFELWDTFAQDGTLQLLLAEYQDIPVAGIILLARGNTIHYAYGASDEHYLNLAPNNLLFWTAMTWGCEKGYKRFDLGRTACDNEGLMEFKRRWGAKKEALPYFYYPHTAGLAATSEKSWKYRLLTDTWRKLPLGIS